MNRFIATLMVAGMMQSVCGNSLAAGPPAMVGVPSSAAAGQAECSGVDLVLTQVEINRSEGSVVVVPTAQNRCSGKTARATSIRVESGASPKILEQGALGNGFGPGTLRLGAMTVPAGPLGRPLRLTLTIDPRNLVPEVEEGNNQCTVTLVGGLRALILRCP